MAWSYLPHTDEDRRTMLAAIGVEKVEEIFCDIPDKLLSQTSQINNRL